MSYRVEEWTLDLLRMSRDLRKASTRAERLLWDRLHNRKLGGFKFRRQHVVRGRIADFFNYDTLLIIELDGFVHNNMYQKSKDEDRDVECRLVGYNVLRFKNEEVFNNIDEVCEKILNDVYNSIRQQLEQ